MNNTIPSKIYDFVFIGLGASNSLILISLIKKGLHKGKRIAIFELDNKTNNDKTYCFWANPKEAIVTELDSIISRRFNSIQVNASSAANIESCPYHYIRSVDLYALTLKMLTEAQIHIYRSAINQITDENQIYTLHSAAETCKAKYVFDSRPPSFDATAKDEIYLHQSFFGLHIKCEKDVFQQNTFDMMNFSVEQNEFTQFMYLIPFSSKEALVELTRFGAEKIELAYASNLLDEFISKNFGKYEKLGEEAGCIPMTTQINPPNQHKGILNTGASANLIKPSTGYGFKNMFHFAQEVTQRVEANDLEKVNKLALKSKARFKFYDRLLLMILFHWPASGKKIFTSLFNKLPILTIFSFLEEKTSLRQEIKIFAALPIQPFLKALFLHLKNKNMLRYIIAFLVVFIYTMLSLVHNQTATTFNYAILIVGLLWIGIPHGALDHILSKNKKTPLILFILQYLFIMGIYLILWQISPWISLVVFVAYSSFHFGESELIENKEHIKSWRGYFKAFLMGLSILIFIIFTHLEESLSIISNLSNEAAMPLQALNLHKWYLMISIFSFSYILVQWILSKTWSHIGLMFLLILGIPVPLPLAFGLYFILQHSHNAWSHLKHGLDMNSFELYKKSSIFTFGALLIFIFIAFFVRNFIDLAGLWANFFIFIACISLPHFVLMHFFYRSKMNPKHIKQPNL